MTCDNIFLYVGCKHHTIDLPVGDGRRSAFQPKLHMHSINETSELLISRSIDVAACACFTISRSRLILFSKDARDHPAVTSFTEPSDWELPFTNVFLLGCFSVSQPM